MKYERPRKTSSVAATDLSQMGRVNELFTVHLQRVNHELSRAIGNVWGGLELRTGTFAALSFIVANPGCSQNDVAKRTNCDKSAINAIVNNIEHLGWAERRPSETDRRRHELHATTAGVQTLDSIIEQIKEVEDRLLTNMTKPQKNRLVELLDQLHHACFDFNNV